MGPLRSEIHEAKEKLKSAPASRRVIFIEKKVEKILMEMPTWKKSGADRLPIYFLKWTKSGLPTLTRLFQDIADGHTEFPADLMQGITVLLQKKKGATDVGDFRPINLLPTLLRVFTRYVNDHLYGHIQAFNPLNQGCGVREQRCVPDTILKD